MGRLTYTDPAGQEFTVPLGPNSPVVSVGRAMDCTIRSNRKSVSRRHAEFRYANGRYEVVDNGSSNGTYLIVNDERRQIHSRQAITHSDEVWCGDFILRFFEDGEDFDSTVDRASLDFNGPPSLQNEDLYGAARPTYDFGASPPPPQQNFDQQNFDQQNFDQQNFDQGLNQPGYGQQAEAPNTFNVPPSPQPPQSPQPRVSSSVPFEPQGFDEYQEIEPEAFEIDPDMIEDLERLREEKASIEELASRQAYELDELRNRIQEQSQELERVREELEERSSATVSATGDLERLTADLETYRHDLEQAMGERDAARGQISALESRLDQATQMIDNLSVEQSSSDTMQFANLEEDLKAKTRDIEVLEAELERMQEELQQAANVDTGAEEKAARLQKEVARQSKLLEEFDARNRDLQLELDNEAQTTNSLREALTEHEQKLDEFESLEAELKAMLKAAQAERDEARVALESAGASNEEHEARVRDLKNEIEGLKMRVKMEKERNKNEEGMAEENEFLRNRVSELEGRLTDLGEEFEELNLAQKLTATELAAARESVELSQAITPEFFSNLQQRIETLERIIDAIERTDLQPLSTVDRIRLQSAIRDTKPKQTLELLREMLQSQLESASAEG